VADRATHPPRDYLRPAPKPITPGLRRTALGCPGLTMKLRDEHPALKAQGIELVTWGADAESKTESAVDCAILGVAGCR
jgi:hypothetical protein